MSIETLIKKLLTEGSEAAATLPMGNPDNGDKTQPKQGSSQDQPYDEEDENAPGTTTAQNIQQTTIQAQGDATQAVVQSMEGTEVKITDASLMEAFTRKHFVAVADMLKSISNHKERAAVGQKHIDMFKKDNPRFDEAKFKKAAGIDDEALKNESVTSLKEDVAKLFEGQENLAEGFIDKATSLFEAAVIGRTNAEMVKVKAQLEESANTELTQLKEAMQKQVDSYLQEMVKQWSEDNALTLESGIRMEVTESFMSGLKDLFLEHYIEVPADKVDVLESLTTELESSKAKLQEEANQKLAIQEELTTLRKQAIISEAAQGLTATDADRLASLVEGVSFDSKEAYTEKVALIKEQHFKKAPKKPTEMITESGEQTAEVSPRMQAYLNAINRGKNGNIFAD